MSTADSCARCAKDTDLKRCSKCRNVLYCSKECQVADWKTHKPHCEPISGSDGSKILAPQGQDGRDAKTTGTTIKPKSQAENSNIIWGVKIECGAPAPDRFVSAHFPLTHPIFRRGGLCPFTALYGKPILLYSPLIAGNGEYPLKLGEAYNADDNQPAVYLRIEQKGGFAPLHWQIDSPGPCYVVRQDREPLTKEMVETMYEFHSSILSSAYFEGSPPYPITPERFQDFSDKYWKKQRKVGREWPGDGR